MLVLTYFRNNEVSGLSGGCTARIFRTKACNKVFSVRLRQYLRLFFGRSCVALMPELFRLRGMGVEALHPKSLKQLCRQHQVFTWRRSFQGAAVTQFRLADVAGA